LRTKRSLPGKQLAVLLILTLAGVGGGLAAQELPDTLRFDPVMIYYPGQPDTGAMKAELRWYAGSGVAREMALNLHWTGAIVCDSFVADPAIAALLDEVGAVVDNDLSQIIITHYDGESPHVVSPEDYKYGDVYFAVLDTGLVEFTGSVWISSVPGIPLDGHWIESSYCISNPGDINNDGVAGNISDVVYLIGYIFGTEPAQPKPFADINGDCLINITDAVCLVSYIFAGGSGPGPGCEF
jgi:hypothetical protein